MLPFDSRSGRHELGVAFYDGRKAEVDIVARDAALFDNLPAMEIPSYEVW